MFLFQRKIEMSASDKNINTTFFKTADKKVSTQVLFFDKDDLALG